MAEYQIVCVERAGGHGPITHVGVSGLPGVMTVEQVRGCIARGNTFYTVSPTTRGVAGVEPFDAVHLHKKVETIRSGSDAIHDNNLDNLQACRIR